MGAVLTTADQDVDLYPALTPAAANGTGTATVDGRHPGTVTTGRRDPNGARVRHTQLDVYRSLHSIANEQLWCQR